jgi:ribosomal protein S27AE
MTISSFFIVLLIFILTGLFILRPFLVKEEISGRSSSSVYDSLIAERERLLSAIEELDLELDLDKISAEEHSRNRDLLLAEAAGVLQKLDKHGKPIKTKKPSQLVEEPGDDLEKMIATRRKELQTQKNSSCPNCGKDVQQADQFCSHCGESL